MYHVIVNSSDVLLMLIVAIECSSGNHATLVTEWDIMAAQLDLPLPEITVDDFHRGWTRFQLVASAKEWNADKQKVILPTLLRGKLVDYYAEFDEATRGDLERLKTSLMTKAGLVRDRLTSSQMFMTRSQWPEEKVADFVVELKKLFKEAYPAEELTSAILLQRFLTGLLPSIRRQLLLRGRPDTLQQAIQEATNVEYALNFDTGIEDTQDVNIIQHKTRDKQPQEFSTSQKFQESLDKIIKRLDTLEAAQTQPQQSYVRQQHNQPRQHGRQQHNSPGFVADKRCWLCGELGHLMRKCPLNYKGPVAPVGSWPQH